MQRKEIIMKVSKFDLLKWLMMVLLFTYVYVLLTEVGEIGLVDSNVIDLYLYKSVVEVRINHLFRTCSEC